MAQSSASSASMLVFTGLTHPEQDILRIEVQQHGRHDEWTNPPLATYIFDATECLCNSSPHLRFNLLEYNDHLSYAAFRSLVTREAEILGPPTTARFGWVQKLTTHSLSSQYVPIYSNETFRNVINLLQKQRSSDIPVLVIHMFSPPSRDSILSPLRGSESIITVPSPSVSPVLRKGSDNAVLSPSSGPGMAVIFGTNTKRSIRSTFNASTSSSKKRKGDSASLSRSPLQSKISQQLNRNQMSEGPEAQPRSPNMTIDEKNAHLADECISALRTQSAHRRSEHDVDSPQSRGRVGSPQTPRFTSTAEPPTPQPAPRNRSRVDNGNGEGYLPGIPYAAPHIQPTNLQPASEAAENLHSVLPPSSSPLSPLPPEIAFDQEPEVPTPIKTSVMLYNGMRMPQVILGLDPINITLPERPNEYFPSLRFLKMHLGSKAIAEGHFSVSANAESFNNLKSYKTLYYERDAPLLPQIPGQHGAQLTCIRSNAELQIHTHQPFALFIRGKGGHFKYFGTYQQPCNSDYLGYDEMASVPVKVKKWWSEHLGTKPRVSRPQSYLNALINQWPKREVGYLDKDSIAITQENFNTDTNDDRKVLRYVTEREADKIETKEIMEAFDKHDFDRGASMKLFYEYLECVGYDTEFYEKLVALKKGVCGSDLSD